MRIPSPQKKILSHIQVQVTLRRELNAVFQELFNSSAKEIRLRAFERYGLKPGDELRFPDIARHARPHNEVALGILKAGEATHPHGGVYLNPDRDRSWRLDPHDQFVVLKG